MAESKHDDLADALARMGEEDVAPSEQPPAAPPQPAVRPPAGRPAPLRAPAPAPVKPARPAAPALGAPTPPPTPARPAAPVPAGSASAVRKARPTAPTIRAVIAPTDAEADGGQSTGLAAGADGAQVIDDDDSVIMPAPQASAFMPRVKSTSTAEARAAVARKKNLNFRRTIIPPLLTMGVLMLVFGFLKPLGGPESMFASLPGWIPIVLLGGGGILLVLAIINMLSVKAQLDAERR